MIFKRFHKAFTNRKEVADQLSLEEASSEETAPKEALRDVGRLDKILNDFEGLYQENGPVKYARDRASEAVEGISKALKDPEDLNDAVDRACETVKAFLELKDAKERELVRIEAARDNGKLLAQ